MGLPTLLELGHEAISASPERPYYRQALPTPISALPKTPIGSRLTERSLPDRRAESMTGPSSVQGGTTRPGNAPPVPGYSVAEDPRQMGASLCRMVRPKNHAGCSKNRAGSPKNGAVSPKNHAGCSKNRAGRHRGHWMFPLPLYRCLVRLLHVADAGCGV